MNIDNIDRATHQKITKPNALIDYNKPMKVVDRTDQYLSYYSILQKFHFLLSVRWF